MPDRARARAFVPQPAGTTRRKGAPRRTNAPTCPLMPAFIVNIDYASDDSCQIRLWARGTYPADVFRAACEARLRAFDGRRIDLAHAAVATECWRTVPADAETRRMGVGDFVRVPSAPGRGAYPVTLLEAWLPLHLAPSPSSVSLP